MKYKNSDSKRERTTFPLKIREKKVAFNKEGKRLMYHLHPIKQGVIEFEDLARRYIKHLGINEYMAVALSGMISEGICYWLKSGHAVNIGNVGTLKPVINCKAHLDPHECSVDDVQSVKLQFYPCKPINDTLKKVALRVENRKEFLQKWKEAQNRKKKSV